MSVIDTVKVWVGPICYRKDGQPVMGSFGSRIEVGCILSGSEWRKLDDAAKAQEQELAELRRKVRNWCNRWISLADGSDEDRLKMFEEMREEAGK